MVTVLVTKDVVGEMNPPRRRKGEMVTSLLASAVA